MIAGRHMAVDPSVRAILADEIAAGLQNPQALHRMQSDAEAASTALRSWLEQARTEGRSVVGYGAPSKASVLLTFSQVGAELLPFTVDLSPDKQGRRIPGAEIPIRSPDELLAARPDYVLILTWDIAAEVQRQLPQVEAWGGRFVVPVPRPRMLGWEQHQ